MKWIKIQAKVNKEFINELKTTLGVNTSTEVLKEALSILKWVVDETKTDRKIFSATKDGSDIHRLVSYKLLNISTNKAQI